MTKLNASDALETLMKYKEVYLYKKFWVQCPAFELDAVSKAAKKISHDERHKTHKNPGCTILPGFLPLLNNFLGVGIQRNWTPRLPFLIHITELMDSQYILAMVNYENYIFGTRL